MKNRDPKKPKSIVIDAKHDGVDPQGYAKFLGHIKQEYSKFAVSDCSVQVQKVDQSSRKNQKKVSKKNTVKITVI